MRRSGVGGGRGWAAAAAGWLAVVGAAAEALGSGLVPSQVLVVYDSRRAGSRDVAEYYAGSAAVPGGAGGLTGARPGVLAFDLATTGIFTGNALGETTFPTFEVVRNTIRAHILSRGLRERVRCIVLCRGIPHRLRDSDNPGTGDQSTSLLTEWETQRDATCASVDSELVLLWQNLSAGEAGLGRDSFSDNYILNPYFSQDISAGPAPAINSFTSAYNDVPKALTFGLAGGRVVISTGTGATRLTPGDMVLVCRLDGNTVDDVRAMIDRARDVVYDTDAHAIILDESDSNGVSDTRSNDELDNSETVIPRGDDFERTRDLLLFDGRFAPANVIYNPLRDAAQFVLGPKIVGATAADPDGVFNGQGLIVSQPIIFVGHYGSNHVGEPGGNAGGARFAESYNYANGAIFNTLESFNGRAFSGTGTQLQQEQIADFIAAGGTFAIGHAWEPLADTIADNELLIQNFVLGNLTWAEAAYASIPAISWAHIVLGDPLARARRTSDDINGDGRVDLDDLYAWNQAPVDINRDGVADARDGALVEAAIRAPAGREGLVGGEAGMSIRPGP